MHTVNRSKGSQEILNQTVPKTYRHGNVYSLPSLSSLSLVSCVFSHSTSLLYNMNNENRHLNTGLFITFHFYYISFLDYLQS